MVPGVAGEVASAAGVLIIQDLIWSEVEGRGLLVGSLVTVVS